MNQGPNIWIRPAPVPVSGPAQPSPGGVVNSTGPVYGTQQRAVWSAGDVGSRQVCDTSQKAAMLWRFSCFGHVDVVIDYGTLGTRKILTIRAPVVLTIPGQFTATATPIDGNGAVADITLTQATGGARSIARQFKSAGAGPPIALSDDAVDFVALVASTLTISGVAVAVPALASVPLVVGSTLNTGSGFQEFEA